MMEIRIGIIFSCFVCLFCFFVCEKGLGHGVKVGEYEVLQSFHFLRKKGKPCRGDKRLCFEHLSLLHVTDVALGFNIFFHVHIP